MSRHRDQPNGPTRVTHFVTAATAPADPTPHLSCPSCERHRSGNK
jgi:hypothetical protein